VGQVRGPDSSLRPSAELVTTELLTNALTHAAGPVRPAREAANARRRERALTE
jgi:hypothetical protein